MRRRGAGSSCCRASISLASWGQSPRPALHRNVSYGNQAFSPLCPEDAPRCCLATLNVPSLHCAVALTGAPAGGAGIVVVFVGRLLGATAGGCGRAAPER